MGTDEIRGELFRRQDKPYRDFQIKLIPSVPPESVIGVRTPALRSFAKELAGREDIQAFLELPRFSGFTDLEFCEWMIKTVGVAAVPGSSFFREPVNHLIRLHFARQQSTLEEALRRLEKMAAMLTSVQ